MLLTTASLLGVLVIAVAAILVFEPRVDLSRFGPDIEHAVEDSMNRKVVFAGPMHLTLSLWPSLEIANVTIQNPEGCHYPTLAKAGSMQCQVGLWPLLFGKLHISSLKAKDVLVCLAPADKNERQAAPKPEKKDEPSVLRLEQISGVELENVLLRYFDKGYKRQYGFYLERLSGQAGRSVECRFSSKGKIDNYPFSVDIGASPLGSFKGRGQWKTSVKGTLGGSAIEAHGKLLVQDEQLASESTMKFANVDIGELVQWLGLVEGIKARARQVDLHVQWSGNDLPGIVGSLDVKASLADGYWLLQDPNTKAQAEIRLSRGEWDVTSGQQSKLTLEGSLNGIGADIAVTGPVPGENIDGSKPVKLEFKAALAGAEVEMTSETALPLKSGDASLAFKMQGQSLNYLSELLGVGLPKWGPYELKGNLRIGKSGYELKGMELVVGRSDLTGGMSLVTTGEVPELTVDLKTKLLQLDDFLAEKGKSEKAAQARKKTGRETAQKPEPAAGGPAQPLSDVLSPEVLDGFKAKLNLSVDQVRSSDDELGSGLLDLSVANGRMSLNNVQVNIPGGQIRMGGWLKPGKTGDALDVWAKINNFDYGVLARRYDPQTTAKGLLSLDAGINSTYGDNERLMANANGYLNVWIKPEDMGAGVMDLWAANIVFAIFQGLTAQEKSQINCLLARLKLTDGMLRQESLVIDTSKMRVNGQAELDFKEETVFIHLAPQAKKAQFFSLETPIEIKGRLSDFEASIAPGGLVGSAVSFVTSPLHVPLRRLFEPSLPEDGCDICCDGLKKESKEQ